MAQSNNAILLRLSKTDMSMLDELSQRQGLMKSEYLRLLIQTLYIAETTQLNDKGEYKIKIGQYGFTLDNDFIEQYAKELESVFKGLEKRLDKVVLSQTKSTKNLRVKRSIKPKKVA